MDPGDILTTADGKPLIPLSRATPREIAGAYRHCARIVRKAAGNFYYAFLLLPGDQRRGIHALYAFCRASDDAVDDEVSAIKSLSILDRLRRKLDYCYQGYYSDELTLAFADSIQRFQFDRRDFDDLLSGMECDLTVTRYETAEDQELYCYRAASTVGLLCLKIFSAGDALDREYAIALGKGMQLTNILRDMAEDRLRGRLYIPASDLRMVGVAEEELFAVSSHEKLQAVVLINIERAKKYFTAARSALLPESAAKLRSARAMGAIYEAILSRIESDPISVKRIELTRNEKVELIRKLI